MKETQSTEPRLDKSPTALILSSRQQLTPGGTDTVLWLHWLKPRFYQYQNDTAGWERQLGVRNLPKVFILQF